MPPRDKLSLAQARRVALAAQGFADPRPAGAPSGWAVRRLFDRVGLVQIDSVNVLQRAHYLPLFSRVGPYDRALMDRGAHYAPRRLFEYWGHEASLIPVGLQPSLRWRMERAHDDAWGGMRRVQQERPELVADVLDEVRQRGPIAASALEAEERPKRTGPWWDWSDVKRAIEFLFWSGQVTSARRRGFERLYDVPEEKRVHGYYVLPFLLGDRLVARADLKADRQAGVLRVQAAHAEDHAPPETGERLREQLEAMARWLGLEHGLEVV